MLLPIQPAISHLKPPTNPPTDPVKPEVAATFKSELASVSALSQYQVSASTVTEDEYNAIKPEEQLHQQAVGGATVFVPVVSAATQPEVMSSAQQNLHQMVQIQHQHLHQQPAPQAHDHQLNNTTSASAADLTQVIIEHQHHDDANRVPIALSLKTDRSAATGPLLTLNHHPLVQPQHEQSQQQYFTTTASHSNPVPSSQEDPQQPHMITASQSLSLIGQVNPLSLTMSPFVSMATNSNMAASVAPPLSNASNVTTTTTTTMTAATLAPPMSTHVQQATYDYLASLTPQAIYDLQRHLGPDGTFIVSPSFHPT